MNPNSLNARSSAAEGRLDLTAAQRGIWYAQKLAPQNPMYQIGQFVEIDGPLEADVLARAVACAVSETDALNVAFGEDSSGPFQYPRSNRSGLVVTDLSGTNDGGNRSSGNLGESAARELMDSDLAMPRDVAADELLHTELITLSETKHFFYQRVHHLLLDGYSAVLVLKRVAELYNSLLGRDSEATAPAIFGSLSELVDTESGYAGSPDADGDRSY